MEAATIFQLAARRGVAAGCVLGVSDELAGDGRLRIEQEDLDRLGEAVGRAGAAAVERRRGCLSLLGGGLRLARPRGGLGGVALDVEALLLARHGAGGVGIASRRRPPRGRAP